MTSKVFVVQNQRKQDPSTGKWAPKYDLGEAAAFGNLVSVCEDRDNPFATTAATSRIKKVLKDFGPEDYLLLVGNPTLIGICVAVASRSSAVVKVLQWSTRDRVYTPIVITGLDK